MPSSRGLWSRWCTRGPSLVWCWGSWAIWCRVWQPCARRSASPRTDVRNCCATPLSQLARLQLLAGDTEAAAGAVAELREHSGPFHMIQPYVIAVAECQLALQQGDAAEAGRLLAQRLADLRRYGMKAYIPETLHLLAQAQQQAGQESDAVASLDEARELAAAIGSRWMEWRILAALASLSSPAEAKELRGRARAIIDGIEQHISDPALLRQSFHNRPDIHSLAHV